MGKLNREWENFKLVANAAGIDQIVYDGVIVHPGKLKTSKLVTTSKMAHTKEDEILMPPMFQVEEEEEDDDKRIAAIHALAEAKDLLLPTIGPLTNRRKKKSGTQEKPIARTTPEILHPFGHKLEA